MWKSPDIPADELVAMVRERIGQGRLPASVSDIVRAGYGGFGATCEVCALEIESEHVEYQVNGIDGRHITKP